MNDVRPAVAAPNLWRTFAEGVRQGLQGYKDPHKRAYGRNDGDLPTAAVRAGVGLGYIMEHDVADEIAASNLIQILADWCLPVIPGLSSHPSRWQSPPALRALIAALKSD